MARTEANVGVGSGPACFVVQLRCNIVGRGTQEVQPVVVMAVQVHDGSRGAS